MASVRASRAPSPRPRPRLVEGRWKEWVAIADLHVPHHDEWAFERTLDTLVDYKPKVIVAIGDVLNNDASSRWPSDDNHTLVDEFEAAGKVLEQLRDAAPKARLVWVEGNHDANLLATGRHDRRVQRLLDYRTHMGKALRGVHIVPYVNGRGVGTYQLGAVTFNHGFSCARNGGRDEAIRLAWPGGLLVRGHTHRPEPVTQASIGEKVMLPYWWANTGTLSKLRPGYVARTNADQWGHGCVVGAAKMGRAVAVTAGGKMGRGWTWEAETIVFRTQDPEVVDQRTGGFRERHPATRSVLDFAQARGYRTDHPAP